MQKLETIRLEKAMLTNTLPLYLYNKYREGCFNDFSIRCNFSLKKARDFVTMGKKLFVEDTRLIFLYFIENINNWFELLKKRYARTVCQLQEKSDKLFYELLFAKFHTVLHEISG